MPLRDALFRPVRAGNAFEETVERRVLAARLGVSRVTSREAIRSLQDAGYVESRRGRYGGTFVNSPLPVVAPDRRVDPGELADALTLRAAVETGAAECAAGRALGPVER